MPMILGRRGAADVQPLQRDSAGSQRVTLAVMPNGERLIQAMRKRLTYANVMATLAVFIALGGSSYAALTITGRDVANNSLTYKDLKRNTLGSSRIKESTTRHRAAGEERATP